MHVTKAYEIPLTFSFPELKLVSFGHLVDGNDILRRVAEREYQYSFLDHRNESRSKSSVQQVDRASESRFRNVTPPGWETTTVTN